MALVRQVINCVLETPYGTSIPVGSCSFDNTLNGGVSWSAMIRRSWLDPTLLQDTDIFRLAFTDSLGGSYTTMDLVAPDPDEAGGRQVPYVVLNGTDLASYLLSGKGVSLKTQHNVAATVLCQTIANLAQPGAYGQNGLVVAGYGPTVTITNLGVTDYTVEDFEIVGEETIGSYLTHLCRDGGWNYRIGPTGDFQIFNAEATLTGSRTMYVDKWKRKTRKSSMYSRIVMRKASKYKASYPFPIDAPGTFTGSLTPGIMVMGAISDSPSGSIVYAACYAGNRLAAYFPLNPTAKTLPVPPITGGGLPSTSVVYAVEAPDAPNTVISGQLIVSGKPPGPGNYDGAVEWTYPIIGTGTKTPAQLAALNREKRLKVEGNLWPTLQWMKDRAPNLLLCANQAMDTVEANARFDPTIWVGETHDPTRYGMPRTKLSKTSIKFGTKAATLTAEGTVVT